LLSKSTRLHYWGLVLLLSFIPLKGIAAQAPTTFAIRVQGQITSGTAGVSIPAGLPVTVRLARPSDSRYRAEYETATQADGNYRLEGIIIQPGDALFITVVFEGVPQSSPLIELNGERIEYTIPLTVYAATDDPSVITLLRSRYVLDPKPGGVVQFLATFLYRASGDRLYLSKTTTKTGQAVSVIAPLPIGAVGVAFDEAGRFSVGGESFAPIVQDTRPVIPGQAHEVIVSYQLSYEVGAIVDQDQPYQTEDVTILIPNDAKITLSTAPEHRSFATAPNTTLNPNRPYTEFTLEGVIPSGGRLVYTLLAGNVPRTPLNGASSRSEPGVFAVILLVVTILIGLAFIVALFRLTFQRRHQ